MSERTFPVVCDFYPQGFLLRFRTERGVLTANDIYNHVRSRIVASGDVAPPASQLRLSIVQKIAGDEQHEERFREIPVPDNDVTDHGLDGILASLECTNVVPSPTLKICKKPGKGQNRTQTYREYANRLRKKASVRKLCGTFKRTNPGMRGSSCWRCLHTFGGCTPWRSGPKKAADGSHSGSHCVAQREMELLLPSAMR